MKNTHSFYTVFQVLKELLIKMCKIQPLDLLFLVVLFICQLLHQYISFFTKFIFYDSILSEKKIFVTNFPFLTASLKLPHINNSRNLLSVTKFFVNAPPNWLANQQFIIEKIKYCILFYSILSLIYLHCLRNGKFIIEIISCQLT